MTFAARLRKLANYSFSAGPKGTLLGYRVWEWDPVKKLLVSQAQRELAMKPTVGAVCRFPGKGLYLANTKAFVLNHYCGSEINALCAYSFKPEDVTHGNLLDREAEIAVSLAVLRSVSLYDENGDPLP